MSDPNLTGPYRFRLVRKEDETGVSGVGHIADGVVFGDMSCVLRWRTQHRSTAVYDNMETLVAIHGHDGKTIVEWIDKYPAAAYWRGVQDAYQDRCEGCMFASIGSKFPMVRPDQPKPPQYIAVEEAYDYLRGYNAKAKEMGC